LKEPASISKRIYAANPVHIIDINTLNSGQISPYYRIVCVLSDAAGDKKPNVFLKKKKLKRE
jgi:hypothetical protein